MSNFTLGGLLYFIIIIVAIGSFWYFIGPKLFKSGFQDSSEVEIISKKAAGDVLDVPSRKDFETPCQVTITRLSSMIGAFIAVRVLLNGIEVGTLKNGKTLEFQTFIATNEMSVLNPADNTKKSINFIAASEGSVRITFKISRSIFIDFVSQYVLIGGG